MERPVDKRTQRRVLWVGRIALVWAALIVARLIHLQVVEYESFRRRAVDQHIHEIKENPDRGEILDATGHPLAVSIRTKSAAINPQRVVNPEFFAGAVRPALGLDERAAAALAGRIRYLQDLRRRRLRNLPQTKAERDESVSHLILARHISDSQRDRLEKLPFRYIETYSDSRRYYPNGTLAAHVVGTLGAEGFGTVGVEQRYDAELRGRPATVRVLMDSNQRRYHSYPVKPGTPGANLRLTLHQVIQQEAEEAIARAVREHHGESGFVVALDPQTGEVLALANYPTFDPGDERPSEAEARLRRNLAITAPLEPGSVMKMITVGAGLDSGRVTPETPINCENGAWVRPGRKAITDLHRFPTMPVREVLTRSSNIGAAKIALLCGPKLMYEYLKRFGLGEKTELGLPGESRGILRGLESWSPSSHEYMAFGHEVAATPLQLARAVAVVANGGLLLTPTLIASLDVLDAESGQVRPARPPRRAPRRVLKAGTALEMRRLMQEVVEHGTGSLARVPGYTAGGKTGTAELLDPRTHLYLKNRNAASFMGFAPAGDPRIVVIATVYGTASKGGPAAGPVFSQVARTALRVLDVPQDREQPHASRPAETGPEPAPVDGPSLAGEPSPPPASAADLVGPRVPDFRGKSVATVLRQSASLGLPVETAGRGRAARQRPPAGAILPAGDRIFVVFNRD